MKPASKINILVIEDNPADQVLIREHLLETHLEVGDIVMASTLTESINLLKEKSFSLIFLDFYLPDSNGLDSYLRLSQTNAKSPVIILSGTADTSLSLQSITIGAQDFLVKGEYTVPMLEKAVKYSIERKKNQELIEENNERYDIILKATDDVIWDWDLEANTIKWRGQGLDKYLPKNIPLDDAPANFWINGLHPDERKKAIYKLHRAIRSGERSWESDNRFLRNDGQYAYINTRGFVIADHNNQPVRMIGSMQDITDRKNAELEATKAKQEAEAARKTQEQFLANMSHEIRTPMNGVIGMSQLLCATHLTKDQQEYVDTIKESANNLMVIINDILDLTKIAAGEMAIDAIDYKLREVIKNSIRITGYKALEKGLQLNYNIAEAISPVLRGDPFRLNQVLVNLIGNAIKFTEKGEVNVAVGLLEEDEKSVKLEFSIRDSGIGIEASKLDNIFERFTQASGETTRKYGGTGLGLTITRQLLELQGGSIYVKSQPGQGSTFTFILPVKKGHNLPEPKRQQTMTYSKQTMAGLKILLAEDNLINQKVAEKILTLEGATVDIAVNGNIAIEKLIAFEKYDVILMDIQMPEMDGYDATRLIREELAAPLCNIPIIAMTASALTSEKEKCIVAGMDDYISKPFQSQELFEKILGVVNKSTVVQPAY